jgi:hypothetical protein
MIKHLFLALVLLFSIQEGRAETQTLFFAKETAKDSTRISLLIEDDQVSGTQEWRPKQPDGHGAYGTISGILSGGGIMQVLFEYTIEGSEQSEEQVLKLEGDKLFIGEGQLKEDPKNSSRLNLQEPNKVAFKKALKKIPVTEPKAGTPERKAIMDAMRGPVVKQAGSPVLFSGNVRVSGSWARFQGNVKTADGKRPKNADFSDLMELDFFSLLKKNDDGAWEVLHQGFAGDIGLQEGARENTPEAPWVLFQ